MKPLDTGQAVGAREGIRASPPATASPPARMPL